MVSNSRGSAPWNEKIDCLSSPTAKIDRRSIPRAPAPAANSDDELRDDVPLLGACVLRLVDQQVIDAKVELVMHPGRAHAGEQVAGLGDQVVVVEEAARFLLGAIARDHLAREREQRAGTRANDDGAAALAVAHRCASALRESDCKAPGACLECSSVTTLALAEPSAMQKTPNRASKRSRPEAVRTISSRAACSRSVFEPCARAEDQRRPFGRLRSAAS